MILSMYLICCAIVFGIGIWGIILNRNSLWLFAYIELMLLAVSSNFVIYSKLWNDFHGKIFVLFILLIVAIQCGIGWAVLLRLYKVTNNTLITTQDTVI